MVRGGPCEQSSRGHIKGRWVGRRSAGRGHRYVLWMRRDRGLPALNRLRCLCWTVCCALTCPGRGSGREDAGDPRRGEMVSVRGHVSQDGEGGLSRNLPWRDAGLPAVNSGVCELAWAGGAARTSVPSVLLVGAGPAAGTPGVLSRRFAPRLRLLGSSAPAVPRVPQIVR